MSNLKLKDILGVCSPDWLIVGRKVINVNRQEIPREFLDIPIKEITGFDDGLTIELEWKKEYINE